MMNNKLNLRISADPYQFDLDQNGFPTFTKKNLVFVDVLINNDSNYRVSFNANAEKSSAYFLNDHFPETKDELQKAIELLNKENSTHLSVQGGIDATVQKIMDIGLEAVKSRIQSGDPELVNEIANALPNRLNFSFASKFCTYTNRYCFKRDDYAIYDNIVAKILAYYAYVYTGEVHWKEISGKSARKESIIRDEFVLKQSDYRGYNELVGRILKAVKDNINPDITRKSFDALLWYYYKGDPDRIISANTFLGKKESRLSV